MTTFIAEARQTLVPGSEVKHGPLPPLLVGMTLVTGLVDAFSYLVLALAGTPGFSILASLVFHAAIVFPLVIALIVMSVIAGAKRLLSRTDPDWVHAS